MNDRNEFQGGSSIVDPDDNIEAVDPADLDSVVNPVLVSEKFGLDDLDTEQEASTSFNQEQFEAKLEGAVELIDGVLIRLSKRETLPVSEVTNLLLDLRLQLVDTNSDS